MPRKTQEEKLAYKAKRARIIDLYNADGDWRRLAMELNVPKSTAYRWVKKGDEIEGRGGRYNQKITAEHKDAMCNYTENNPRITLAQIVERLHLDYGLKTSKTTVFRHLDMSLLFSFSLLLFSFSMLLFSFSLLLFSFSLLLFSFTSSLLLSSFSLLLFSFSLLLFSFSMKNGIVYSQI